MNNLELYGMKQQALELYNMLLSDEIDEETYDLQLSFYKEEIVEKAPTLIQIYKQFEDTITSIDDRLNQLKEYKKFLKLKDEKFKEKVKEILLLHGLQSGKSKGIMTGDGILYLHKSKKIIKPNINEVLDKYKTYKIEIKLTDEELALIPRELKEKFKIGIKEIQLNKELYEKEQAELRKEDNFTLKVY